MSSYTQELECVIVDLRNENKEVRKELSETIAAKEAAEARASMLEGRAWELVKALDTTSWSSWQTTAHFEQQWDAMKSLLNLPISDWLAQHDAEKDARITQLKEAGKAMLSHSCVADADPSDKDARDNEAERLMREALQQSPSEALAAIKQEVRNEALEDAAKKCEQSENDERSDLHDGYSFARIIRAMKTNETPRAKGE